MIETYATHATRHGARLVCFPECFLQGYCLDDGYVAEAAVDLTSSEFDRILRSLEHLEPTVVVGLIERTGHTFFNSAVAVQGGNLVAVYRKTHLLDSEQTIFQPGDDHPVFDVCGTTVGINICYDLNFNESVKAVALAGAKLLACPCNNMMPRKTAEQWKRRHNEIRSQRAQENGMWLLSSDVTGERNGWISYGPTAVIDPSGAVIDQVPLMTTGMAVAEIE